MTKVNVTKKINASAQDVWKKLASFEGVEHFSPIAKSVTEGAGEGASRSCFMPDDSEIKERLTKLDNDNMHLEYIILSGPFPFTDYVSNVYVKAIDDNNCKVSWGAEFNTEAEAEMTSLLEGFYNAMIEGLKTLINSSAKVS